MQNSSALLIFNSVRINDKILANNKKNQIIGAVAQLGARLHGMQEVTGSIPVSSTFQCQSLAGRG